MTWRTSDGVKITPGLRVFTYDGEWCAVDPAQWRDGTSSLDPNSERFDGWFNTTGPSGRGLYNGERMAHYRDWHGRTWAESTAPGGGKAE